MHPILSDRKKLTIYSAAWIVVSFLLSFSVSSYFVIDIFPAALFTIPILFIYAEINLSAWYIAKTFSFERKRIWKTISGVTASVVIISLSWTMICWVWLGFVERFIGVPILINKTWIHLLVVFGIGTQLYLLSLAISYLALAFEASRTAERDAFEMKLLAHTAELKALRMQINPHFLFNSLNSINALITQKPEKAREMTTLLADFFRKSVQFGSKETISVKEELSLLTNYLDIERIRFGSRLGVDIKIDETILPCSVPPLLLQPILENAVKHGISNTLNGGTIKILAEKKNERIFITIENPDDNDIPKKDGTGLGLEIVRKRLNTIFGNDGDLQTFNEGNIFRVILFFPMNKK